MVRNCPRLLLGFVIALLAVSGTAAQSTDLVFETSLTAGPVVLWERGDPATYFAVVTISGTGRTVRYQNLFEVRSHNETIISDLVVGERVTIEEFAGVIIDGVPQVAATHRSAAYQPVYRLRLPLITTVSE